MHNVLTQILKDTQIAVAGRKKSLHLTLPGNKENNFVPSLFGTDEVKVIAEIKAKSPSHGEFETTLSIEERAKLYQHAGADAISYVSNFTFFGGLPMNVKEVKKATSLPILQKDFVIDSFQVYESAYYGADALLLIARIVTKEELNKLVKDCKECNIEPVVEVFDEEDLVKIDGLDVKVVGVNSRNLDTLATDIDKACTIISRVSKEKIVLGFSGVTSRHDVEKYVRAGARGVLIGASVMKADSVMHFIDSLK